MRALILFFALCSPLLAQVGKTERECEKLFGEPFNRGQEMKDGRLKFVSFRPVDRSAPGVHCVFDEDGKCIAVSYMTDKPPAGFMSVIFDHNGGRDNWKPANSGSLLAVRSDRKFAAYRNENGWPTVASERYAKLMGWVGKK